MLWQVSKVPNVLNSISALYVVLYQHLQGIMSLGKKWVLNLEEVVCHCGKVKGMTIK